MMKSRVVFFLITLVALSTSSFSQISIENSISTDSIDLFAKTARPQKSANQALVYSLILPGTGHQSLGKNRSALTYLTIEAAGIFGALFCHYYAERVARDAASYAWLNSGANGSIKTADDYYWKLVGRFMDTEEFNRGMDLNRTPEDKITDPDLVWYWNDEQSQSRYNTMRKTSRTFGIASAFCVGALVLDRIVAFIQLRAITRQPEAPDDEVAGLHFRSSFNAAPSLVSLNLIADF